MTIKELIDRLNEFNCPDCEIEISNGIALNASDIRFAEAGNKVTIYSSPDFERLDEILDKMNGCYRDIDSALDELTEAIDGLGEFI